MRHRGCFRNFRLRLDVIVTSFDSLIHRKQTMNLTRLTYALATAGFTSTLLIACGGGGGDAVVTPPVIVEPPPVVIVPPTPTTLTISGVVAKGAPFEGATVVASNPTGPVGTAQTVNADGTYAITLPIATATPIVLTASKTQTTGEVESYTSVVADKANTRANITPITNVIAALLSSNGNPTQLAAQVATGAVISQTTLAAKTKAVQDVLQTASTALGVANANPLTEVFSANGAGYDKLLDSVNATITPAGASSNIEIGMKVQAASDSAQPPVSQFSSNQTAALPALPAIASTSLLATGTTAKLAQLMLDASTCYALPLATRVSTATSGSNTAVGAAADVVAPACKGIFMSNDPSGYKFNGGTVGRNASGSGSFAGLFSSVANNVIFDAPVYEYTLPNGDVAFTFRTTRVDAVTSSVSTFARLDPADQKLKFIGNQFKYNGSVQAFMQTREFLTLNQSQWNYLSSGYSLNVDNTGQFQKVEVTAPNGRVFTLVPSAAVSYLILSGKGATNFVRLRSEFSDATKNFSVPAKLINENSGLAFESPAFTEAEMVALPSQSAWTFKYFLTGNTGVTADAVQVYRTRGRALGMAEIRSRSLATLSSATVSNIVANALPTSGVFPLTTSAAFNIAWTVPAGALAPTSSTMTGRYLADNNVSTSFSDSVNYSATSLSASIACSTQNAADTHCAGATGGGFKTGSTVNSFGLTATDALGRAFVLQTVLYSLTIAP